MTAQGSFAGAVKVPVKSLIPGLAAGLGQDAAGNGTVAGFTIKSDAGTGNLCLNADTTGPLAGRNGDQVELWDCDSADSEIWIPVQWERSGQEFTWLVNYKYQSECMNADNVGGLADRHRIQLWDCYNGSNEYWDFRDWHDQPHLGTSPSPIYLKGGYFCIDADRAHIDMGDGDRVQIWQCYDPPNQLWS
jgi:hypothetical protein